MAKNVGGLVDTRNEALNWLTGKKRIKCVTTYYTIEFVTLSIHRKYVCYQRAGIENTKFQQNCSIIVTILQEPLVSAHIHTDIYPNKNEIVNMLTRVHDSRRMEPHFIEYSRIIAKAQISKAMRGCEYYTINSQQILTNFCVSLATPFILSMRKVSEDT